YLSLRAVYEWLELPDPDHASPELLTELLARGDRRLEGWIESVIPPMRRAINILESVLDPDAIVLGGFMPLPLLQRLFDRLEPLPLPSAQDAAEPRPESSWVPRDARA